MIPFFLCWGSFLNVLAYRLVQEKNILWPRSHCPQCNKLIFWYDNIPVFSWIFLRGKCRQCKKTISWLYPFIELLTLTLLTILWFVIPHVYFFPYFIFFSALIVTIRSDLETMLISRFVTLFLVPVGFIFSSFNLLPLTLLESIIGSFIGSTFLIITGYLFWLLTKKRGIGQGDIELLAFIGSFIGPIGCWMTLLIGSIIGSIIGLGFILYHKKNVKIPFGPFLALGAISYVLFGQKILSLVYSF